VSDYWWLIIGMTALTFLPRYLPLAFAGKVRIPLLLKQALELVPIAVLTAIVVQMSLVRDGTITVGLDNHYLIASVVAFAVALWWRHLMLTIVVGLVVFAVCRVLLS